MTDNGAAMQAEEFAPVCAHAGRLCTRLPIPYSPIKDMTQQETSHQATLEEPSDDGDAGKRCRSDLDRLNEITQVWVDINPYHQTRHAENRHATAAAPSPRPLVPDGASGRRQLTARPGTAQVTRRQRRSVAPSAWRANALKLPSRVSSSGNDRPWYATLGSPLGRSDRSIPGRALSAAPLDKRLTPCQTGLETADGEPPAISSPTGGELPPLLRKLPARLCRHRPDPAYLPKPTGVRHI